MDADGRAQRFYRNLRWERRPDCWADGKTLEIVMRHGVYSVTPPNSPFVPALLFLARPLRC